MAITSGPDVPFTVKYTEPLSNKASTRTEYGSEEDDVIHVAQPQMITNGVVSNVDPYDKILTVSYEQGAPSNFRLWKNGEVVYFFPPGFPADLKSAIEEAMQYVQAYTNVCFREFASREYDKDLVYFITNQHMSSQSRGKSPIGRVGGSQLLFINSDEKILPKECRRGAILHELGHAIGLQHEHQLPTRDQHIKIDKNNTYNYALHYRKITQLSSGYNQDYDIFSVMHYAPCLGSKNGRDVFTCLGYNNCPNDVGQLKGLTKKDVLKINALYAKKGCSTPTLMLMDVSGSMAENNKIFQAKQAALNTIHTIKEEARQSKKSPEIGILVFSGDCIADPTTVIQPFSTDLDEVQTSINHIPFPNGNTPSPQAIESAKRALEKQLSQKGQTCGSLIIMTDGQSSCGTVIPPNVYSGKREIKICGQQNGSTAFNITLFAVGFDVPPGSVAERELQYLANTSGGKYFNAQDQYQLTRSFQKINRIYTPIANPQTKIVDAGLNGMFNSGYIYVTSTQQYDTALVLYKKFTTAYPADSSGLYNYALMCEANERYKTAVKYYELYLQYALNDPNRQFLLDRIATLRKDYDIQLAYNKQVIQSDLAYLKQHFEQLRTTPNAVPLAGEFAGFIQEKQTFYKALPDILEMEDGWLKQYAKEIAQASKEATYFLSKKPGQWDLNGVSIIGNVYEPLDRLAKKLGK